MSNTQTDLLALDTVHTATGADGVTTTTTWHDTRAQAKARAGKAGRVFPGGCLGAFRAVTWSR